MKKILVATAIFSVLACAAQAQDQTFPGPKIRDAAPFNKPAVMLNGRGCPMIYKSTDLLTRRPQIAADVRACVKKYLGINEDIGLTIVDPGIQSHTDCVIPSSFLTSSAGNKQWPVCCPMKLPNGTIKYSCRLYSAGG